MNPLELSPREFQYFLTEERQYRSPEQIDDLIRRYNQANTFSGWLSSFFAPQEGRRRTNIAPASVPEGMSLFDALKSGEAQLAVPQSIFDTITGTVRGVENPRLAAQGRIPAADMNSAGMETAAAAMGLGGLLATKPAGSVGSNALFSRPENNIMDEFRPETYYHGTRSDIDAFDPNMVDLGVHVGTKGQANERLSDLIKKDDPVYTSIFDAFDLPDGHVSKTPDSPFRTGEGPAENAQILPLKVRADYPLRLPDVGEWDRSEVVMYNIEKLLGDDGDPDLREAFGDFDFDGLDDAREQYYDNAEWKQSPENREFLNDIRERIKDAGYDSIVYRNAVESSRDEGIQDSMIVLDPRNLRSVNAEFDPYFEYSSDLLAANASKSAGLLTVASDVADRGDQILNMLKSGRGSEVTDAMLDMGDSVKNTQLNQYLAANYDLPMDEGSRLERAREMGFNVDNVSYHGTKAANLDRFNPEFIKEGLGGKVIYSTDMPEIASGYAGSDMPYDATPVGSGVLPLLLRGNRKAMPAADLAKGENLYFENVRQNIQNAKDEGFSGMDLQTTDPTGAKVQTTFDASDVRSQFARFDPRLAHLSNLTAANASKSAGLLAVASDVANRGDQVLSLLKSGKGAEVTDAMLDMGDSVKNAQLNQYLAANYDLPMDEASRLARAREMGFEGGLLHGTGSDITAVDPAKLGGKQNVLGKGFYQTTNPERSDRYVPRVTDDDGSRVFAEGGNVMPLMTKSADEFDLTVPTGKENITRIANAFEGSDYDVELRGGGDSVSIKSKTDPKMSVFLDSYQDGQATLMRLKDAFGRNNLTPILQGAGFTGLKGFEGSGSNVRVNYNPQDVRSQFARFDPRLSHLSNLTAANASPIAGLLTQAGMSDKQADKIEKYLNKVGLLQ